MKRILSALFFLLLAVSLAGCSGQSAAPANGSPTPLQKTPNPPAAALSAGEDFKLGDETYALEKWIALPEYDTDTHTGVGLCFMQKEGVAPIILSGGGYRSLIDMTLDTGETKLSTSNISFIKAEDVPGYSARVTFEFALPKETKLPAGGTVFHTGENEQIAIDLSKLDASSIKIAAAAEAPPDTAALDEINAQAFCGEWLLTAILFRTPDANNGIYTIDAAMSISEGFEYGRVLRLDKDWSMVSFIDLSALIEAVPELPFTINELDLKDYSGWAYANGTITLTNSGPAFAAVYDEASEELRLTRSGEVAILPHTENGMITQSGAVRIDITMVFKAK